MHRRDFLQTTLGAAMFSALARGEDLADNEAHPLIRTRSGVLRGQAKDGIASFLGIPYGADTRTRRFQAPLPAAAWTGVRDAVAWGDRAPQLGSSSRERSRSSASQPREADEHFTLPPDEGPISENCLHLNVWTRVARTQANKGRPVLVYIHGGAYNSGTVNSVLYDGTRLCQGGDVVVVTVNHRLNAFGFLYLGELTDDPAYADSGNAGMLDLVLALQWVQENIATFGGDPGRVTIFGQSGGGAKCATLMAMPEAHGLFHRVMTMSGQQVTAAPKNIATARTREFLTRLGLEKTPPNQLRQVLDAVALDRLEEAARVSSAWLPVVDGRSLPRDPFAPDAPPLSQNVPMILGNTHDETRGLIGNAQPALFHLSWEDVPAALTKNIGAFLRDIKPEFIVARYREWYPGYSPSDVFFAVCTAFRSWPGQVIEAERRASSTAQQWTWVYQMDWPSPVAGGKFGAPHTVDIPFFFDNLQLAPGMVGVSPQQVEQAQPLATAMSETLRAFAHTGNPNHSGLPHWPAYNLEHRATMIWNTPLHVQDDPRGRERELAAGAHYRQPGT